jgi:hypothetical protein
VAEICGYCKKNNAYCSYLKGIPICGVCLERYLYDKNTFEKKEATTMQVTYNGFTGELVKLERTFTTYPHVAEFATYDLVISVLQNGVCAKVSFTGVKLEDMKFLGGEVTFDG